MGCVLGKPDVFLSPLPVGGHHLQGPWVLEVSRVLAPGVGESVRVEVGQSLNRTWTLLLMTSATLDTFLASEPCLLCL